MLLWRVYGELAYAGSFEGRPPAVAPTPWPGSAGQRLRQDGHAVGDRLVRALSHQDHPPESASR